MKRRDFIVGGSIALGTAGCSLGRRNIRFEQEYASFVVDEKPQTLRLPQQGAMDYGEIGSTGIRVSKLCFGSHMPMSAVPFERFRRKLIRDAFRAGVNFFDVYDEGQNIYQYEPMGTHIEPFRNEAVISIVHRPYNGRTPEQEMERVLRLFRRDWIDLVRCRAPVGSPAWDTLLRYREKGHIRAVGLNTHDADSVRSLIEQYPLDFVLFPYNFYGSKAFLNNPPDDYEPLATYLRRKGLGVLTMKAFSGDFMATPFDHAAKQLTGGDGPAFTPAALRYVLNSGINADATYVGMYNYHHLNQNLTAFYQSEITPEEQNLLTKLRGIADRHARTWLPGRYQWLTEWVPRRAAATA